MGGAINFRGIDKELKWRKIFGATVAGRIRNIYSTKDYVLIGYSAAHLGAWSGGRIKLSFEEDTPSSTLTHKDIKLFDFKNYNITNLAHASNGDMRLLESGHLDYRSEIMYKTLELIKY